MTLGDTTQSQPGTALSAVSDQFSSEGLPDSMARAHSKSQLVTITATDGVAIPVRVFGENVDGRPVLMLHGLQSHSGWFVQSGAALANGGFPVYIIERRGSGQSDQPRGDATGYEEMVSDIAAVARAVRDRHECEAIHVTGHCFGAIPATIFACQQPDQVQTLVLPTPGLHTHSDLTLSQKLRIVGAAITGRRTMIPVPLETTLFTQDPAFQDFIRRDGLSLTHASATLYRSVPAARRSIRSGLGRLTMPIFMALAGQDRICDNAGNRATYDQIPVRHKKLSEYGDAIHILEFSPHRDEFFADLCEWFSEH